MKRSFKLITILGIPVEVNLSWFIIFALIVYTLAMGYFPITAPGLSPLFRFLVSLIAALLLFASLLLHELSHSVVAKRNDLPISGITLFIFGGVAHMEKEPSSPQVEFKMAIAGPLCSFALAAFFYLLSSSFRLLGLPVFISAITDYLFFINLVVAIFNLIPGFPLDGGRVFRSILWYSIGDLRRSTRIASSFGKGFALVLMALGFLSLIRGYFISGIWFIFLGLFLQEAAESSYRQVVMKKILSNIKVKEIMTKNVIVIPARISLKKLVDEYFFKFRHASFPMVEDDTLLGLVTFHDVKEIDKKDWAKTNAHEILIPLRENLLIHENEEVMEALSKMAKNQVGRLLVIEDSKLMGILSQKDIFKLFQFKSEMED